MPRSDAVVSSLERIQACEKGVANVQIPEAVVSLVDEGRNPDAYMAELVERNTAACEAALGKTSALQALGSSVKLQAQSGSGPSLLAQEVARKRGRGT